MMLFKNIRPYMPELEGKCYRAARYLPDHPQGIKRDYPNARTVLAIDIISYHPIMLGYLSRRTMHTILSKGSIYSIAIPYTLVAFIEMTIPIYASTRLCCVYRKLLCNELCSILPQVSCFFQHSLYKTCWIWRLLMKQSGLHVLRMKTAAEMMTTT